MEPSLSNSISCSRCGDKVPNKFLKVPQYCTSCIDKLKETQKIQAGKNFTFFMAINLCGLMFGLVGVYSVNNKSLLFGGISGLIGGLFAVSSIPILKRNMPDNEVLQINMNSIS